MYKFLQEHAFDELERSVAFITHIPRCIDKSGYDLNRTNNSIYGAPRQQKWNGYKQDFAQIVTAFHRDQIASHLNNIFERSK